AEDAAYAIFELAGGVVAQMNSSWCVRVDRGELFELQVDGTDGTAVAGLREWRLQPSAATPRASWKPDLPDPIAHRGGPGGGLEPGPPGPDRPPGSVDRRPGRRARQRVQGAVGAVPAPRRDRR